MQELKTKFAVTEEVCRTNKEQVQRLQQELKDKAEQAQALDKEHVAVNMKVAEMQARMDCKEQQHAQIMATMSQAQDMHTTRLKEVEQEKEAVAEQLRAARVHADDLGAQVLQACPACVIILCVCVCVLCSVFGVYASAQVVSWGDVAYLCEYMDVYYMSMYVYTCMHTGCTRACVHAHIHRRWWS